MLLQRILLLFATIFSYTCTIAQQDEIVVTGRIFNEEKLLLSNASISLTPVNDTTIVLKTVSDTNGVFRLKVRIAQQYKIVITYTGYADFARTVFISKKNQEFHSVVLYRRPAELAAVTVIASRPIIEKKPGVTIYNVTADPMAIGKSLADITTNIPGVSLGANGNPTVDGDGRVIAMINGRKSNMNAVDVLNQIQAGNVDKVELITGADPRFASMSGAAILNIVLKKNKQQGTSGSISLVTNNFLFTNVAFTISRMRKKVNQYIYLTSDDKFLRDRSYYRRINTIGQETLLTGNYTNNVHHSLRNLTNGVDIYADSLNIITVEHSISFHNDQLRASANQTRKSSPADQHIYTELSSSPKESENIISINHRRNFKKPQRLLETEVSGTFFTLNNQRLFSSNRSGEHLSLNNYAIRARTEYQDQVKKNNSLLLGADVMFISTVNKTSPVTNSAAGPVGTRVDYINRRMAVFSAYTWKINNRWTIRPGLRVEKTHTLATGNKINEVKFDLTTVYLTLNILYDWGKSNSLSLDFIRKIEYPDLYEFYAFQNQPDSFNVYMNNPQLIPLIRHNLTAELRFKTSAVNWTIRGFSSYIKNVMPQVSEYRPDGKIITYTSNVGNLLAYGSSVTSNFNLTAKWNMRVIGNFNFSRIYLKKQVFVAFKNMHFISGSFINKYEVSKKSDAELAFRWMNIAKGLTDVSTKPMYNLSLQYNRQIKDGKWVISLRAHDILFTMKTNTDTYAAPIVVNSQEFIQRSRYLMCTVRYKFGNDDKKRARKLENEKIQFSN